MYWLYQTGKAEDGLTVLEVVIVMVILMVLVGIVISTSIFATRKVNSSRCKANQEIIEDALKGYYLMEEKYPEDLRELQTRGYIKSDFDWECPADSEILYYQHYDRKTGTVECPLHPSD